MKPSLAPMGCTPTHCNVRFAGHALALDVRRALWWPEEELLAVADLHFGKSAAFQAMGVMLPPYETTATLARLETLIETYRPRTLLSVGDAFHRRQADALLDESERRHLLRLMAGVAQWVWIAGNHDPLPPSLPGLVTDRIDHRGLTFAHEVRDAPDAAFLACGHYHPKATLGLEGGGRSWRKPCFAWNAERMLLPAFGALSGGLDVTGPVIAPLLGEDYHVVLCDVRQPARLPSADLRYRPV